MDGLASPLVDEEEGDPVSGNETSGRQDQVSDADVVEVVIHSADTGRLRIAETNSLQDDSRVETESVESNLKEKYQHMMNLEAG